MVMIMARTRSWNIVFLTLILALIVVCGTYANAQYLESIRDDTVVLENSSLILAADRTYRRDPLNGLKRYQGGWNISNKHYWASVGFTGIPLFVLAAVWFIGFGLALCGILIYHFCKRKVDVKLHPHAYTASLVLLIIFTCGGITGSIILYNGQGKFHRSISKTMGFVIDESELTVQNLRNVTDYLSLALVSGVDEVFLPVSDQQKVDSLNRKIRTAANELESKTKTNSHNINRVLDTVRIVLIVLAAFMLALAFVGLVFSIRGWKVPVYILVLIAWVLVTATFVLCGVFLLLTNVVGDSCVSMEQWVTHPYANTSLDEILPCVDVQTAKQSLDQSKEITGKVIDMLNIALNTIVNKNASGAAVPLSYNQSGPPMPLLCNPYTPQLKERNCSAGEVSLEDAPMVWRNYTCTVSSSGDCITPGRLTPAIYEQLVVGVKICYGLYHYAPFLIELQDCTFVRDTFSTISKNYCPGLRKQLRWVYIGLAFVGSGILLSIVLWVIYIKQRSKRDEYYKKHPGEASRRSLTEDDERGSVTADNERGPET